MKLKSCTIGLTALLLLPSIGMAEVPDLTGTAKHLWIAQVKMAVSEPVCKSFVEDDTIGIQMKERSINYDKCMSLMPTITDKCLQKYDANLPATITDESAEKWGRVIGECIGNNFAMRYLYSNTNAKPGV